MITSVKIEKVHFYPGIHSGLMTKTVIVKLSYKGDEDSQNVMQSNFKKRFEELAPADDHYIKMTKDWKKSFLIQSDAESTFPHWIVGLTTAIQLWARDPVGKGKVLKSSGNTMVIALPWERKDVFISALNFAVKYLLLWSNIEYKTQIKQKLSQEYSIWLSKAQEKGLAPNTLRFALAAMQRNIPVTLQLQQIKLGFGKNAIRMYSSFTGNTSTIGSSFAKNKLQTNILLRTALIPTPITALANTYENALEVIKKIPFPVVVKPTNQDQGVGITTNILANEDLKRAFDTAQKYSPHGVIVEKHIQGDDHRMLIVRGKLFMTVKRIPGGIIGDGKSSIQELLDILNNDPLRGEGKRSLMMRIPLDNEAKSVLNTQNLNAEDIPQEKQFVKLRYTANLSNGGTAVDVTDIVHPDNRFVAERAAEIIGLDIAGIDFLCPDISRSWKEVGGAVIEVNAQPGFRPHWLSAPDRDINAEIIEWLFHDKPSRIPTAAITGTNGKTTTSKMLHHIWMSTGKNAGVCTTNGVWIGKHMISDDNLSGNPGGRILLNDPTVEAAIIEMTRKGLIIFGHPSDQYDVSALLNIQNDHIGVDGIHSLEEMAILKSEVIQRTKNAIVMNAEDILCMQIAKRINHKKLILVSMDENLPTFQAHIHRNGMGVSKRTINATEWIVLTEDKKDTLLMPVSDIPATMDGLVSFNISNAMFAAGLAWVQALSLETIRTGLATFKSSVEQNPGRMNFIEGFPFKVLLDNSHNPDGIRNLTQIINQMSIKGKKRVLLQNIGNRHSSHFQESTADLSKTFDEFIVSCDPKKIKSNNAWGNDDPIGKMIKESIDCLLVEGVSEDVIQIEADQKQAIRQSLKNTMPDDLLVILTDAYIALPIIENLKKEME